MGFIENYYAIDAENNLTLYFQVVYLSNCISFMKDLLNMYENVYT